MKDKEEKILTHIIEENMPNKLCGGRNYGMIIMTHYFSNGEKDVLRFVNKSKDFPILHWSCVYRKASPPQEPTKKSSLIKRLFSCLFWWVK
jgi:hypothetical protein